MALPATAFQARTTELEAINLHLAALGLNNVQSLNSTAKNSDAYAAHASLLQTSREVQSMGWHFNTFEDFKVQPSDLGEIILPANLLRCESSFISSELDLVEQDGKLWSNDDNTFIIGKEVYLRWVALLGFNTIPEYARWYIVVRSVRRFVSGRSVSQLKWQFTSKDEQDAKLALETADGLTRKGSLAKKNVHVNRMRLNRGRR